MFMKKTPGYQVYDLKAPLMACFNQGNGFGQPVKLLESLNYGVNYPPSYSSYYTTVLHFNSFITDINADGAVEFIYPQFLTWDLVSNNINGRENFKFICYKNQGALSTDLLTSQTSSFGGSTDIAYVPSSRFNNTGGDARNDLSFVIPVVNSTTKNTESAPPA